MAAIFQLSDGVQVGAAGALRGFKDTAMPMAMCIFSYWVVGFPLAYVFGVRQGGGPPYVWFGLIAGLTVSAVLLVSALSVRIAAVGAGVGGGPRRAVIAVAERFDLFDQAVDEADLAASACRDRSCRSRSRPALRRSRRRRNRCGRRSRKSGGAGSSASGRRSARRRTARTFGARIAVASRACCRNAWRPRWPEPRRSAAGRRERRRRGRA